MKMDIKFGHYVALPCKCMKVKTNVSADKARWLKYYWTLHWWNATSRETSKGLILTCHQSPLKANISCFFNVFGYFSQCFEDGMCLLWLDHLAGSQKQIKGEKWSTLMFLLTFIWIRMHWTTYTYVGGRYSGTGTFTAAMTVYLTYYTFWMTQGESCFLLWQCDWDVCRKHFQVRCLGKEGSVSDMFIHRPTVNSVFCVNVLKVKYMKFSSI